MEQTAINWLSKELERLSSRNGIHLSWIMMDNLLNEAAAIEHDAIVQAYSNGWHDGQDVILSQVKHIDIGGDKAGEQYFNETFKTEDND